MAFDMRLYLFVGVQLWRVWRQIKRLDSTIVRRDVVAEMLGLTDGMIIDDEEHKRYRADHQARDR